MLGKLSKWVLISHVCVVKASLWAGIIMSRVQARISKILSRATCFRHFFHSLPELGRGAVLQSVNGSQFYWFASKSVILHSWKNSLGVFISRKPSNMIIVALYWMSARLTLWILTPEKVCDITPRRPRELPPPEIKSGYALVSRQLVYRPFVYDTSCTLGLPTFRLLVY